MCGFVNVFYPCSLDGDKALHRAERAVLGTGRSGCERRRFGESSVAVKSLLHVGSHDMKSADVLSSLDLNILP